MQAAAPPSKFEQQGAHALLTTAVSAGLGLLLSVLVSRALGPAGKGVLDVTSATTGLFALVLGGSLNAALIHFIARHGSTPSGLVVELAFWAAAAGAITAICLAVPPGLPVRLGLLPAQDKRFWIAFVVVSVGFGVWSAGLRGILVGQHALIAANRIDVAIKAALFAVYVALAWRTTSQPKIFALAGVGAAILLALALLFALRRPAGRAPGTWSALLAIALPVHSTNILHFFNQRADVFFVQAFHGAAEVGLYALAVSLAQCVLLISSALAQPLLPEVSAAGSSLAAAEATARTCRLFVALGLLSSGALALAGLWLVPRVFGRGFSGSLPSLLVLLPGMIAFGLTNLLISHFVGVGRSRINLWISLAALAVTIAGNLTLTRRFGGVGAAATSTGAYGLAGALSLWFFRREAAGSLFAVVLPRLAEWRSAITLVSRFRV